jgi:hypothetical protein
VRRCGRLLQIDDGECVKSYLSKNIYVNIQVQDIKDACVKRQDHLGYDQSYGLMTT